MAMPALQALLDGYAAEMKAAEGMTPARSAKATRAAATEARQVIAPLLSTHWGQDEIYAEQCFNNKGSRAVAGPAATALAQVLYYHRHPRVMETSVPAYTTEKGHSYDELPPTVFEWDLMLDSYLGQATEEQIAAVAHLVSYAAHAAQTDFGRTSSTATAENCAAAFNGCLGYDNPAKLVTRDTCGVEDWDRLIYHELSQGRPVVYFAATGLDSTHAFVCDGYDGEGLFHVNWGKEGDCDGYYRLHAFHPASLVSSGKINQYGYSMQHQAIVGISPITVEDNYGTLTGNAPEATWQDLEVTAVQQLLNNNLKKMLRVSVANHGTSDFAGPLRLQIGDSFCSSENLYVAAGGSDYVDFYFLSDPGTYAIKVVDGASSQVLFEDDAFEIVNTEESSLTIVDYEVFTTDMETMTQNGSRLEMEVTVRNDGTADYFGNVELKLYNLQGEDGIFVFAITSTNTCNVVLAPGETRKVMLKIDDLKVGDRFYFTIRTTGNSIKVGSLNQLFTVVDGYAYWDKKGIRHTAALAETTQVPTEAVAVDFSGRDLTAVEVVPNDNPNTLYYIDTESDVPAALYDNNVVMGATAVGDIVFHDGYDSFVPRSFDVEGDVSYIRSFDIGGFGKEGWQTVILPFAVKQVSAGEKVLDWQHGCDGKNYDFYLRGLNRVGADTAYFEPADQWMPNVPYLVAVPDGRWGDELDLTAKTLRFSASNARVERTAGGAMVSTAAVLSGTTGELSEENVYVLNEAGDAFVRVEKATVNPFRCWFAERAEGAWPYDTIQIASQTLVTGDANNDGLLSVVDVMQLVGCITGSTPLSLPIVAGDVTCDTQLSVADVMAVVEMVLH